MIEVFKTNINDPHHADLVLRRIHSEFEEHEANFDLEDVDKILRVRAGSGIINSDLIVGIVRECGFDAQVL